MEIETLKKGIALNDKIKRERSIVEEIDKLHLKNVNKTLTSEDIKYLIERAYEGCNYILDDLKVKLKELQD